MNEHTELGRVFNRGSAVAGGVTSFALIVGAFAFSGCGGSDGGDGATNGDTPSNQAPVTGNGGTNDVEAVEGGSGASDATGGTQGGSASGGASGGDTSDPDTTPTCVGAGSVSAELTDPTCDDGQYCEALPDLSVDISGMFSELEAATELSEMTRLGQALLDAAWPFGGDYLRSAGIECHERWADDSWGPVVGLAFALHECGHSLDFDETRAFEPSAGYVLPVPEHDFFAREEIASDEFHGEIPDAAANDIYFGGITGGQGIQTMFSEWSQYNHDLGLMYTLQAHDPSFGYEVELALNFAWAAPRYLLWAKDNHQADYDSMMSDEEVRTAILVFWGQTLLYYDALASDTSWTPGSDHTQYIDAIRDPAILAMMDDVRIAQGCEGIQ